MDILISGAGIAGLTTAYWLRRHGFNPIVVERAGSLVTGGYKIDVRGSALDVLRRMGAHDAVADASTKMRGAQLVDRDGNVISEMTGDEFGHRVGDDLEIVRGELCEILLATVIDVEVRFGDVIESVTQSPDGVEATFRHSAPRRSTSWSAPMGCTPTSASSCSATRRSTCATSACTSACTACPTTCTWTESRCSTPRSAGRRALEHGGRPRGQGLLRLRRPRPSRRGPRPRRQEAALREVYAGIGWEVPYLLAAMPEASDWYFDIAAQVEMPAWSQDRVVLVGDAGYCPSPMSGQGSSVALIGAYVLAGELAAAGGDHRRAFDAYEQLLRPFIAANHELGLRSASFMTQDPASAPEELSGNDIESVIDASTQRITEAANAITLRDYAAARSADPAS